MNTHGKSILEHKFDDWVKVLMGLPTQVEQWQLDELTADEELGPYRDKYRRLPIKDNGEPLVDCSRYALVSRDYYLNKLIDGDRSFFPGLEKKLFRPSAWVRRTVAESLAKVDQLLRAHDLFLVVNSGWRHPEIQRLAIEWSKRVYGERETIRRFANVDPTKPQAIVPHQTGGACDLELWSMQLNKSLSRMDLGDEISLLRLEQKQNLNQEEDLKRGVRRILYQVLTRSGVCLEDERLFTLNPNEFWHFGYGDSLSAYFSGKPYAIYGSIEPSEDQHG